MKGALEAAGGVKRKGATQGQPENTFLYNDNMRLIGLADMAQINPNFGEQTLLIQPVGTELGQGEECCRSLSHQHW